MFAKFRKNTDGNVAMMFGIISTMLMVTVGVAIDGSRLYTLRANIQNITDTAALTGAHAADIEQDRRWGAVREAIDYHFTELGDDVELESFNIAFDDATESLVVSVDAKQDLLFAPFLGKDFGRVSSETRSSYALDDFKPVSIAMILDASGSMGQITSNGRTRIETVKLASGLLFEAIEDGSQRPRLVRNNVRTGLNVYNHEFLTEHTVPMTQGWDDVLAEINTLEAEGGTRSTDAFEAGYTDLKTDTVQPADLQQFIVFMTDGNNNQSVSDTETLALCEAAKAEGMRVFTVAFEAPANGEALLEACASIPSTEHFFSADNGQEFRAAFQQIGKTIASLNTRITN